ncbi:hypothetical protein BC829DRAFT_385677 [Chytridium lagenaria]|nr:hypothetical protein BC829DRAFT_385677 [Chytridium lagenaria]
MVEMFPPFVASPPNSPISFERFPLSPARLGQRQPKTPSPELQTLRTPPSQRCTSPHFVSQAVGCL